MSATAQDERTAVLRGCAETLEHARSDRAPVGRVSARFGLTAPEAYTVQRAGRALREGPGNRLVGYKIGLTSAAMQARFGIEEPDSGYLLEDMILGDGAEISLSTLIAPMVEVEIAVLLARDLPETATQADAQASIGSVAPAIEVVDSRIADWDIVFEDTLADNASSALAVIGAWRPLGDLDLAAVESRSRAGSTSLGGSGADVLGHPAAALARLGSILAGRGERARAGDIVMTGAMSGAVAVAAGDEVVADLGPVGSVRARVVA